MIELPDHVQTTDQIMLFSLSEHDDSGHRKGQSLPGASQVLGCRRQTVMRRDGHEEVNVTRKLPSVRGTAFHTQIEKAIQWLDPKGERFLTEVTVPGAPGMGDAHVDFIDLERKVAADWKTSLKKNLRYFPKASQRTQVQIYGDRLVAAGYDIEFVELVAIPMDGVEEDIRLHRELRNPEVAQFGYDWFASLDSPAFRPGGGLPEPELSGSICYEYCPFFGPGSCHGKTSN